MKKFLFPFLLISFFLSVPNTSNGQQFNFQNYSVNEGLAQSQVYAMLEDRWGFIWLGTQGGGVCRFDGKKMEQFTVRDGLVNAYVEALFEDKDGNIWIGTQNGLSKFDGKKFQNFELPESNFVTAIAQEPLGKMWIGTSKGTYQMDDGKFTDFKISSSRVNCFLYDNKNNLWIGTDESGVYQMRDGKLLKNFKIADGLTNNSVRSILQDDSGNIYFGNYNGGVNVYNGAYFSYYRTVEGLASNLILNMLMDEEGRIWIASQDNGVTIWDTKNNTFTYLDEADGLANNHVRKILKDHWGNLWFGTSGGGVSKYSGQQFVHYNQSNGLAGNQVYGIAKDSLENLWLATSRGVSFFDGKKFTETVFPKTKSKTILVDDSSRVWVGLENQGLALFALDTVRFFTSENGLNGNWVKDIIQDQRGKIWVSTSDGGITQITVSRNRILPPPRPENIPDSLYQNPPDHYEDFLTFKKYRKGKLGLASNRINDLHVDKKNRIWYATRDNGIGFIQNDNKIFTISKRDGLPENHVRSLTEDEDGNLWIGMASQGISKIKIYANSVKVEPVDFPPNQTLTSNNVYLLGLDEMQNLWVGSETGVDKIEMDAARNPMKIKHFGKAEGFAGIETCQNSVVRDKAGNLWFGTMNGLTKYNPQSNNNNPIPPILHITSVQLNYESLEKTEFAEWSNPLNGIHSGLKLPWDKNNLEFEFQGINHSNPEKVLYQWKMEGYDERWSPPRPRNNTTYKNLPPKKYTFLLRAINEDGVMNETPLEMSFEVLPAIWQTWWFKLVSVLLGVSLIGWLIKSRIDRIRRKAAREKERLQLEKNLLSLEQKALQLQMNPHFIFNALNSIQSLISQKDTKTARYQLAKFSKLMRSILENSRSQTISLEDEIQTLQNYLAIEKSSRGDTFDFEITTLLEMDTDELQIPPMMLQPFVENAIIHGVAHLSEKGKIDIHFLQKNNTLECTIADNGIGRTKAKEIKSQVEHQHKSAALQVTQERLDILLKNKSGEKGLEIIDLVDARGEAVGTKVMVRLPIEL